MADGIIYKNTIEPIAEEIWLPVIGFEDSYSISNMGRVKTAGRIKLQALAKNGYLFVGMWRQNKLKNINIARNVGLLFVSGFEPGKEINHINGVKTDNRFSNLEWVTKSENSKHRIHVLGQSPPSNKGNLNSCGARPRIQLTLAGEFVREWPSAAEIERQLGFSKSNIDLCCMGINKTSRGFIWKYK